MKIAVAVSGGVDSLAAIVLLKQAGHQILALHGQFLQKNAKTENTQNALAQILQRLHIPLCTVDARAAFQKYVLIPSVHAWLRGETPNPCGLCNQHIKFGLLLQAARSKGYLLATGHYACLTKDHLFCPATDTAKEQNYFLSLVAPPGSLPSCLSPGHTNKS